MTTPPLVPSTPSTSPDLDPSNDLPPDPTPNPFSTASTTPPSDGSFRLPPGLPHPIYRYVFRPWVKLGNPILLFEHLKQEFGEIAHYNFLGTTIVFVNNPDYIREILVTQAPSFVKERTVRRMKVLLGEGLITADDPIHMRQRKIAAPAFHRQRIAGYATAIAEIAANHAGRWQPGQTVDIAAASMELSLEIVARTLFDLEVTPDVLSVNHEVNTIMDLYNFIVAFPRLESFLHLPIPGVVKFRRSRARLDRIINRIIRDRRAELEANGLLSPETPATSAPTLLSQPSSTATPQSPSPTATQSSSPTPKSSAHLPDHDRQGEPTRDRGDVLSMLLLSRYEDSAAGLPNGMSDEQIRDEALTIFLAGYETVANALTWTWYLLSQNPEAEARLHQELDRVLGTPNREGASPAPDPSDTSSSRPEHNQNLSSRPERTGVPGERSSLAGVESEVERPASPTQDLPQIVSSRPAPPTTLSSRPERTGVPGERSSLAGVESEAERPASPTGADHATQDPAQNLSSRPERSEVERPASPTGAAPPTSTATHRLPTLADLPSLPYTEQVFAESMRLFPPAWAMGRMSTRPVTLGPYRIPPGAHFFCSQYMMGRSPEYFPDPLRFDPDRHTPEAKAGRHKFTYFPFGGGGRQCIGESFAWMEGILALATVASRWRLRYTGTTPPVPQARITLRPAGPVQMELTPR